MSLLIKTFTHGTVARWQSVGYIASGSLHAHNILVSLACLIHMPLAEQGSRYLVTNFGNTSNLDVTTWCVSILDRHGETQRPNRLHISRRSMAVSLSVAYVSW